MRLLFSSVLSAAILIGGETVVLPQAAVRVVPPVVVPQVVVPQVTFPQVVMPAMVVPYPFFGNFYYNDRRRDVYSYGRRGYASREQAHRGDRGARGGRR